MLNRSKPACGRRRRQGAWLRQQCIGGITSGVGTSAERVGVSPAPQAQIQHLAASLAGDHEFAAQVITMLPTLTPSHRDRFGVSLSAPLEGNDSRAGHTDSDWHPPIQAFLIADVRGYTRFTLEQGDEAAARLTSRFAHLMRLGVTPLGGRVLELRGDEALVSFASARNALRGGAHLQQRFTLATVQDPRMPLPVGIGIDAGEAVPVEGGFRRAALNLAARLCRLAGPGEIFASEAVIHLARKVGGLHYQSRGLAALKGFPEPVRVTMVQAGTTGTGLVNQQQLVIARKSMIRVLLVDDQPVVRRGLGLRLHLEPDLFVVGEAGSGTEALTLAETLAPDVVLMDVEMPELDGIQATTALRALRSTSAVVIMSIHDDLYTRAQAQAAGAVAFVTKNGLTEELLDTIRQAAAQRQSSKD